MCSTPLPSRASSIRWRPTRAWIPSRSGSSAWEPLRRRAGYSRRWRGWPITRRSGRTGGGETSPARASGKIRVHKVWLAVDGGVVVQPAAAKANVESAIIYGLSCVLHERISIKDGVVEQSNFHDYNVMRMSDLPEEINVQFIDVDTRPTGLGEIGNPFIAGAISNALYRLSGKRLRHMPFTPERVLETLKA